MHTFERELQVPVAETVAATPSDTSGWWDLDGLDGKLVFRRAGAQAITA
jgi:hypothetical protein